MQGKDREEESKEKEGGRRRRKEEEGRKEKRKEGREREDGTDGLSVKGGVAEQETHRMMYCLGDFRAPKSAPSLPHSAPLLKDGQHPSPPTPPLDFQQSCQGGSGAPSQFPFLVEGGAGQWGAPAERPARGHLTEGTPWAAGTAGEPGQVCTSTPLPSDTWAPTWAARSCCLHRAWGM